MNSVNLIGRLTRDPELRSLPDGRPVCELRLAISNGKSRKGEERDATNLDVATFEAAATACAEHLRKGRQVGVSGRLVYREWEAEDGTKRSKHSVIGRVEFLGSRPQNGNARQAEPAAVGEDDPEVVF